jgi:chromosome segregation ATPase
MKKRKLDLEVKRFTEFKNGMQKINHTLQHVYQRLTIHGDCNLGYTDETKGLFEQGVWFQVHYSLFPFLSLSLSLVSIVTHFNDVFLR